METWSYPSKVKGECITTPSNTIPGDSMSVREVLDRHIKGLPYKTCPTYFDEQDIDDDFYPEDRDDYDLIDADIDLRRTEANIRNSQSEPTSSTSPSAAAVGEHSAHTPRWADERVKRSEIDSEEPSAADGERNQNVRRGQDE